MTTTTEPEPLKIEVANKYVVHNLIGEGTFGKIFTCINKFTNDECVIKIDKIKMDQNSFTTLRHEAKIYDMLKECRGIPLMHSYGIESGYYYLILDKLGASLEELKNKCGGKLQLKTVLMIGIQLLSRIEAIHNEGVIHRDIKPENFMIGVMKKRNTIYAIDYGLSKIYVDKNWQHMPLVTNKSPVGTSRYISLNVHEGFEPSRRDDLESIGYVLIYLLKGKLPWQNANLSDNKTKTDIIYNIKLNTAISDLCLNIPYEFMAYIHYCRNLKYDDTPNYTYLKNLFLNLLKLNNYKSEEFEWHYF